MPDAADQKKGQARRGQPETDDLLDGKAVVQPSCGEGKDKRRKSIKRGGQADLPAGKTDFLEIKRDEEEDGVYSQLTAEVDEMNKPVRAHSESKADYYRGFAVFLKW
jgi:hypothetical protein